MATKTTIDHDEIKGWAEDHGGRPALIEQVTATGGTRLRIDFLDSGEREHVKGISWDEFFDWFEQENLALRYPAEPTEDPATSELVGRS